MSQSQFMKPVLYCYKIALQSYKQLQSLNHDKTISLSIYTIIVVNKNATVP